MPLNGTFDVKLGKSFLEPNAASYLTMRYDFMPASVDRSQPGSIKVDDGKEVVVSLPNVASVAAGSTVFRGSARPVQKECVLIYNKRTNELTLERIAHAVQLKKTREEQKMSHGEPQPDGLKQSSLVADRKSGGGRKPNASGRTKQILTEPAITKETSSSKARTLSSSSSASCASSDGGERSHIRANSNEHDQENDLSDSSSSSSSLEDAVTSMSASTRNTQAINVAGRSKPSNASGMSDYLPAHRKLIEHDLKLSDSDSDD